MAFLLFVEFNVLNLKNSRGGEPLGGVVQSRIKLTKEKGEFFFEIVTLLWGFVCIALPSVLS